MKPRPKTWILLSGGVLLCSTAGFVLLERQRRDASENRLTALERESHALRQEVTRLEVRQRDEAARGATPAVKTPGAAPPPAPAQEPPLTPEIMAALRLESGRADARSFYAPFFVQRGFGAEKIAAFAERLARNEERMNTLATGLPDGTKNDPNDPIIQSFRARQHEQEMFFQADMEAFLGADDFARFQQFQLALRFWTPVQDFAGRLHDTDTPLTPAQASQLAGVLVAQATDASGKIGPSVTDWESVFTRAAGFLSPPQLAVLKIQHDYDETWRQLNRMTGRARAEALAAAKAAAAGTK